MDARPLLMRLGMGKEGSDQSSEVEFDVTSPERLPFVVEVHDGVVLQATTKLTEVKRETTDDN